METRFVERLGVKIAYQRVGNGPLVMLVQGLGAPGRLWMGLSGGLERKGYSVVVPDNRGTGRSDVPRPPYRMRDLADDLASVLDAVGEGPALVVGISLGGMIAQHLALRHPSKVAGLVLAATTCGPPFGRMARLGFIPLMLRSLSGDRDALHRLRLYLVDARSLEAQPRIFDIWDREFQRQPTSWLGFFGQFSAAAGHSTWYQLKRIICPVEVITGEGDRIIPQANSRILAKRIPGARLTVVPETGHAFPLERPLALVDAIDRVQARISSARQIAVNASR